MINLQLSDDEAQFIQDVCQMWSEGIEAEVERIAEEPDNDVHWARYGLRKQFEMAGRIKLRIELEKRSQ